MSKLKFILEMATQISVLEKGRVNGSQDNDVPGNSSMPSTDKSKKKSKKRALGKVAAKPAKKTKKAVIFSDTDVSEVLIMSLS